MLGRYQLWARRFDGEKWRWIRLDANRKTKYRKAAEKRSWRRTEIPQPPAPLDPLEDPSDCVHGCNGDCEVSGSDRCSFTCHNSSFADVAVYWERPYDPDVINYE